MAAGAQGALPHAQPRDEVIPADTLLIIDWGALLDGYCSDCTRTYATGEGISDRQREAYASVLEAQLAGLEAVRPGISGRDADAAAREVLERAGLGERFGHGLGHGVGLEVHEAPRLSRTEADESCRRATSLRSSRASTCPASSGCGSRTWSRSGSRRTGSSPPSPRS